MPAANAERVAARDMRRAYEQQRRRSSREGAVIGDRNARSFDSMMGNQTSMRNTDVVANTQRRGQDINRDTQLYGMDTRAGTARRGQDVTARGQDLNYDSTLRGHDVTRRGQDLNYDSTLRGHDVTRRGQDVTMRGQDSLANTAMRNTDVRQAGANLRNTENNDTRRDLGALQAAASQYSADLKNNAEVLKQSDSELEGFAYDRKTGGTNQRRASRYKSVRQDLLKNGFDITNMEQVVRVSHFFDELNAALGEETNQITAANFSDPENQARIREQGFWESLVKLNLGSSEQIAVPGAGDISSDEVDTGLDYNMTGQLGLRGRRGNY